VRISRDSAAYYNELGKSALYSNLWLVPPPGPPLANDEAERPVAGMACNPQVAKVDIPRPRDHHRDHGACLPVLTAPYPSKSDGYGPVSDRFVVFLKCLTNLSIRACVEQKPSVCQPLSLHSDNVNNVNRVFR
jgi:hypothetical protein